MKLTGGEIIAEYLIKEGVPYIAGIPGHGNLALVDAFKDRSDRIKVIQVRHEQSAVHLADGYYRVTGRPLAVFASIGPGAVNTAEGVACSYLDSIPVLVLTGDVHTYMMGKGVLQEIERRYWGDFPSILKPIVKRYWQVPRVDILPYVVHRAFNQMMSGRRGPVLIDIPMDIQSDSAEVEIPEPTEYNPDLKPAGDPEAIDRAAKVLSESKRPVILAGGGAITAEASDEIKELAEYLGAAVITTIMGKGIIPENHDLYAWHTGAVGSSCGNRLANTADVILAVGCRFEDQTCSSYIPGKAFSIPPTKLIHVDIDPSEIGKNYPVEVGIVGDAKLVLEGILVSLKDTKKRVDYKNTSYYREIRKLKEEWLEDIKRVQDADVVPVSMARFYRELREFLDEDAILLTSAGNPQAHMMQHFLFYKPRTNLTSGGFSTMGYSLPAAIGAKLGKPDSQVVAAVGDGDFMMTVQELATAVQYEVPVVVCVLNNVAWQSIRDLQVEKFGEDRVFATEFRKKDGEPYSPNFAEVARAFGAFGERVERAEEIKPALDRAFKSGLPSVVEVMVNREYRENTLARKTNSWWDVTVPAYLKKREDYMKLREQEKLF
ncbi:MAG: thiamine pyrophosphate-binding protein [bacterium]